MVVWILACAASSASASTIYFHNDLSGSPVVATNSSGAIVWRESYRPYGERLVQSPASADNSIWYAGNPQASETGPVLMGVRWYDPAMGRFLSTDPKGF